MALTGMLLTLAMTLGADPGAAPEATSHASAEASSSDAPTPADYPPPPKMLGGWSVSEEPTRQAMAEAPAAAFPEAVHEGALGAEPHVLRLAPPTPSQKKDSAERKPASPSGAVTSIVSSLAVVLGLFFVVVWFAKRNGPKGAMLLPREVVEVLGRTPLSSRCQMHVVRFGNKLVLLSITPGGAEPLAEIENPAEVERLAGICQELQHGSISETFRQVFSQFNQEPTRGGFAGASRE